MAGLGIPWSHKHLRLDSDRGPVQIPLGLSGVECLKRLATIFLLIACVLLGAYLALPLWLPSLVRAQLAEGWQLESLEFEYPVSFILHVDTIVLNGNPNGISVRVAARDLDINIHQLSLDAASMDVDIVLTKPPGETGRFALDDLAVPVIFQPGKLPRISIDSLRLNLQSDGITGNSWLFEDVQLDRSELTESRLKTSLPLAASGGLSGQIEIRMLHDSLEAQLHLHLPDHSKILQIDFRQSGEAGNISSEINGQGKLQALQPLLKTIFPGRGSPLGQLKGIQGQFSFEGHFAGSDEQILDRARITARNVMIDMENESLGLDFEVEAQREQDWIQINFLNPGTFHLGARNEIISRVLSELLSITHHKVNSEDVNSAEETSETLELTFEAQSKIKLQFNTRLAGEFKGAASLELSSTLIDLSLDLARDAQFQMAEPLTPPSLTGSGTVNIKLESTQALTFENTASPSLPLGASLQASGWLELDGHTVRFTQLTGYQAPGFQAFTPRLIAGFDSDSLDFHDLELSGITEFSLPVTGNETTAEFRYSGSVQSKSVRISQSEPGQSPQTLIESQAIDLQLDFSQSGEQLRTNGMGALHDLRMDSSGISASQVDFEWSKVDPLAVSGGFRTHTRGLVFSHEEDIYQGVDLDVAYALLSDARIEGQGDLLFAGDMRTPIRFSGGLDSGDWLIDIPPSQLSLRQAVKVLETITGPIPGQLELGGGTIEIEGSVSMGKAVQGNMKISGKALGFALAESTVEGADFNIMGKLNETLVGTGWFSIDRIGLAAGLNLYQTRVSIGLMTPDTIELDDLQAGFFGGHLSADHIRLSPEGLGDTQINMTDIDLGQVLEYIDIGGLQGTGKLEISLPAGSRGSKLYVRNGVFRANGPGTLNYSGSMSAAPVENIGLSALENFHYSELDGTIDYNTDGSYQLKVHLVGSNPDLYDGYPVALNLNIGGMLPEAFEVLFLTGDFDKAILNRIRQEKLD
jgi:hypothetical protein